MKKTKLYALLLAAVMTASVSAGCLGKKKSTVTSQPRPTSSNEDKSPVDLSSMGSDVINGELGTMVSANDTDFTLNAVLDTGMRDDNAKFIYFDITLRNNTDKEYELSTLNNFYIQLPQGTKLYSEVRTQLYAGSHFKDDKYFVDPFTIPSNGQFSGIIGGFILGDEMNEFDVCFFPTGKDPNNKKTVIKYKITADKITAPDASVLK
ncbi:hypothetical protein SAMN02910265_00701 [Ruminococcus flavefaciens]|uniref:DUF4352 domain-containing protein n=1 Tax=Ruminococcus flavefaciens TaxID=1265 RepID=A0A1H6IDF9_RUMFL|nr:hypothetical protein [Ruminococcus flavefaciens]SEH45168.1 hypothetical protein SAMN02910265_00701 [Ruminococcus flavefaciens]